MKKKFFMILAVIMCFSFLFIQFKYNLLGEIIGNNDEIKGVENEYSFIYSHPFSEKSYFITTNDGKKFNDNSLKVNDIFNLTKNHSKNGGIYLVSTHENVLHELDRNLDLKTSEIQSPLTFIINDKDIAIKSYNETIDENILEIEEKNHNKTYTLKFPPYLTSAVYDNQNIYLLNNSIDEDKSVVYVIDRKKSKVINSIELPSSAQGIIKMNNDLVVSSDYKLSIISIQDNFDVKTINYPVTESIYPDEIYVQNEKLYVTYGDFSDGSINVWVLDKNYKTITNEKLKTKTPYTKVKFYKGKLYVLTQDEGNGVNGGEFDIFNLTNLRKESTIFLPKKDIKVQDFIIE